MNLGNELARDFCPEKYSSQGSIIKDTLPTAIVLVLISLWSGGLMGTSFSNIIVSIVFDVVVFCALYAFIFFLMRGVKKRLAKTYISICEYGVKGVCPYNGYKNRDYSIYYKDISKINVKKDQLFIYSKGSRTAVFTLHNAAAAAELIKSKMNNN